MSSGLVRAGPTDPALGAPHWGFAGRMGASTLSGVGNDYGGALAGFAGASMVVVLLLLLISAAGVALGVWIMYTIIWRAVRRGMREFHGVPTKPASSHPTQTTTQSPGRAAGPRDW